MQSEGFVPVIGGRVWYRVCGSGDGVPLLLVHGGPGFPHDYLEPLAELGDERRVIFWDQLGCGRSDRPVDPSLWTLERLVDEVARVRAALGLERVHLLGQSSGAAVAVEHVLGGASGVAGLVLSSPLYDSARFAADARTLAEALPPAHRAAIMRHEAGGAAAADDYQDACDAFYHRHVCRLDPWPDCLRRSFAALGADVYQQMWGPSEFHCEGTLTGYSCLERLRGLGVPTLYACGEHDEATPQSTRLAWQSTPGSRFVVFADASHMPHLEDPDLYLAVLRGFLRDHD